MGDEKGYVLGAAKILETTSLTGGDYDGILLVSPPLKELKVATAFQEIISKALKCDPSLQNEIAVLALPHLPAQRLVYAPTGILDPDYDDVRSLQETAVKGVKRALSAGIKKLLVVLEEFPNFENSQLVTLLGVLEALYVPIHLREIHPSKSTKLDILGVYASNDDLQKTKDVLKLALELEHGRFVARDIGGGDPERMSPINIQKYVEKTFANTPIKITVVDNEETFAKEYPLFEAVNRAASTIERHRGRILYLQYDPPSPVTETLLLVGKGVTYDTGGADIKAGGVMSGMSRDKCGAAAVAGFMKIVSLLKPKSLKVIGAMSLVRNSVGENCYVSDEFIVTRSKAIVRVGNTDAEGRMIMADVLCRMKEIAVNEINPHLFTIATLTGHACLTVGSGYTIVLDNGPARNAQNAAKLQRLGHVLGDAIEISTIRREDFAFHKGKSEGEDILQANNLPSSRTSRGHQGPAAFLMLASGLDKHGSGHDQPLKYTHVDIAASGGDVPHPATGAPIIALTNAFILR